MRPPYWNSPLRFDLDSLELADLNKLLVYPKLATLLPNPTPESTVPDNDRTSDTRNEEGGRSGLEQIRDIVAVTQGFSCHVRSSCSPSDRTVESHLGFTFVRKFVALSLSRINDLFLIFLSSAALFVLQLGNFGSVQPFGYFPEPRPDQGICVNPVRTSRIGEFCLIRTWTDSG